MISARVPSYSGLRADAAHLRFTGSIKALRTPVHHNSSRSRHLAQAIECRKVTVLGAAGGIGQPLSLLLKMNKLVTELALYDIANTPGVAADLSHCNTPVKVIGYVGPTELPEALKGAELVVIPAGVPRKPGMTRDDLFNINAGIVKALCDAIAKYCPTAIVQIISNPVNSTVPIACETFKAAGTLDPRKVMGVTSLDVVRSNTFVAELKGLDLKDVDVPVIGGHAGITILPLLSQTQPKVAFTPEQTDALTKRIQEAGTEVVNAKAGTGSATLSMAYAAARMAESTLLALNGEEGILECTFVQSDLVPGLPYFASKVKLGVDGIEEILPLGELTPYEQQALEELKPLLQKNIEAGVNYANKKPVTA